MYDSESDRVDVGFLMGWEDGACDSWGQIPHEIRKKNLTNRIAVETSLSENQPTDIFLPSIWWGRSTKMESKKTTLTTIFSFTYFV